MVFFCLFSAKGGKGDGENHNERAGTGIPDGNQPSESYKLVKQSDFPVIHVGSRILIPVEAYKEWLREGTVRNSRSHEQNTKKTI